MWSFCDNTVHDWRVMVDQATEFGTVLIIEVTYITSWFVNECTFTYNFREGIVVYATIATVCNMFS